MLLTRSIGKSDLQPLMDAGNERADFLLQIIQFISGAYEKLTGWRHCVLHDPLAAAVSMYTDMVKTEKCYVDVELRGELTRGMTVVDSRDRTTPGEGNINVALEVDAELLKTMFMNSLLSWVNEV